MGTRGDDEPDDDADPADTDSPGTDDADTNDADTNDADSKETGSKDAEPVSAKAEAAETGSADADAADADDEEPNESVDGITADDPERDEVADEPDDDDSLVEIDDPGSGPPGRIGVFAVLAALLLFSGVVLAAYGLVARTDPAPAPSLSQSDPEGTTTPLTGVFAFAGDWKLKADGQSFVGYRIDEQLIGSPFSHTVTGRTTEVEGFLRIIGNRAYAVAVDADLTKLTTDDKRRDDALKTRGLETDKFPKAVFVLGTNILLTEVPPAGREVNLTAEGDLRLHGVVKKINVDMKVQVIEGNPQVIEVVGVEPITLSDYGMQPPDVAKVMTVKPQGALEFKLRFVRS